jgi:hypothetical protein
VDREALSSYPRASVYLWHNKQLLSQFGCTCHFEIAVAIPVGIHRRQEPFCVDHKTYANLSTFVKYVIKFVGRANPITNFEFVKEYAKNIKRNIYLIFIFLPYSIQNLDYVSHARFNCVVIAKSFRYLNYEEDYVSTAYLTTYLDFVVATWSMSSQWGNKCGHYKI